MDFIELQTILQKLTNKKILFSSIAEILNVTPANISKRAKTKSEITVSELQTLENYYGINIYCSPLHNMERQYDNKIELKKKNFGQRLEEIRNIKNMSNN